MRHVSRLSTEWSPFPPGWASHLYSSDQCLHYEYRSGSCTAVPPALLYSVGDTSYSTSRTVVRAMYTILTRPVLLQFSVPWTLLSSYSGWYMSMGARQFNLVMCIHVFVTEHELYSAGEGHLMKQGTVHFKTSRTIDFLIFLHARKQKRITVANV